MSERHDLVIVGAGPAGAAAAIEAASLGLDCVLIDESEQAGGQVYRARGRASRAYDKGPGAALRSALRRSDVTRHHGARVWMIEPGFRTHVLLGDGSAVVNSDAVILATGAIERVAPVPGWTLPGVIGLAAATTVLKAEAMLPGGRVVVAGRGPLLLLVASLILDAGGEVAAIVDGNPARAWLAKTPALLSRPDLVAQGAAWLAKVVGGGVPLHFSSRVVECQGSDGVEAVVMASGTKRISIGCDAVCLGHGLAPTTELSRQIGASHIFEPSRGGWHIATDIDGRSDVARLYACGDGAGVLGVGAAYTRGRVAARAAAHDLGRREPDRTDVALYRSLASAGRFGAAMTALGEPGLNQVADAGADTIICRCEGVRRSAIDEAIASGARSLDAIKAATRCGMGPCGARYCGESAAALLASATGRSLAEVGQMRGRSPVRPLPLSAVMDDFDYTDIPFPEIAPL